eukprot:snap_masked-scaffold_7-processed-gene-0.20-mRNA-1 protein AED:1.00 eAED:1.00 QI:0/0/0/0/1/1/3/0/297
MSENNLKIRFMKLLEKQDYSQIEIEFGKEAKIMAEKVNACKIDVEQKKEQKQGTSSTLKKKTVYKFVNQKQESSTNEIINKSAVEGAKKFSKPCRKKFTKRVSSAATSNQNQNKNSKSRTKMSDWEFLGIYPQKTVVKWKVERCQSLKNPNELAYSKQMDVQRTIIQSSANLKLVKQVDHRMESRIMKSNTVKFRKKNAETESFFQSSANLTGKSSSIRKKVSTSVRMKSRHMKPISSKSEHFTKYEIPSFEKELDYYQPERVSSQAEELNYIPVQTHLSSISEGRLYNTSKVLEKE